ncbi:putative T7SS-secreted protein [Actinophytocola gossypii]|uniref:Putative T7SS secretion signal domain-containing protein n=1 Tax=Actinophytocola gossypii TaxID=2812003 RepID=A0ABT2J6S0_9PSEU|nr:hypothetical protein [Actinophytocola gossypii]MCT2583557.1 hypothetical protein [Actinophytocola gossypii]
MAELGQTEDPKELIPGEPSKVTDAADALRTKADTMDGVAQDLGNVRIPDWEGPASSEFWDKFTPEKANWELARDAMRSAAGTLDSHSSTLTWAQGQAAEAIDLWNDGVAATNQAIRDFEADGGSFNPGTDPNAFPGTPSGPQPIGGRFTDPGAAKRQQAKDILDRAREQLKTAGDTNAEAIDKQGGKGDNVPSWLSGPAQFVQKNGPQKVAVDIKATESWLEKAERQQGEGNRFARYGQWGEQFQKKQGPGVNVTLVGGKAEVSLWGADAKGATQIGDVTLAGQAGIKVLGAEASASAGISQDGITGQAKAGAYLAQASAEGSAHYGIAEVGGSAQGMVGAEAGVKGSIGMDGVNVGAEAFAGARATGEIHGDVGGVGAGLTGEAWAGAGAEASATFGKNEDGKWTIGAEAGVGLGVGAKLGFEITVDPDEVTDTLGDAANAVGDVASDVGSALNPFD